MHTSLNVSGFFIVIADQISKLLKPRKTADIFQTKYMHKSGIEKSQQLHKGISVIKEHVNDQNVIQLTNLLAVQLTLSLGGQLTLETFHYFLIFDNKLNI